jgi:hypothetical protein
LTRPRESCSIALVVREEELMRHDIDFDDQPSFYALQQTA